MWGGSGYSPPPPDLNLEGGGSPPACAGVAGDTASTQSTWVPSWDLKPQLGAEIGGGVGRVIHPKILSAELFGRGRVNKAALSREAPLFLWSVPNAPDLGISPERQVGGSAWLIWVRSLNPELRLRDLRTGAKSQLLKHLWKAPEDLLYVVV